MNGISFEELEAATAGRYKIQSLIGVGGMGAVYLGIHRELGSRVAIKILPPEVRLNPGRLARFRREAALSAQLSHPHLVPVFELEVGADVAFLVMPYIDGEPLDEHLRNHGVMSFADVRRMLEEIGGALSYAHRRGVVHRDIKPANILRDAESGRWLITDFGVAHVTSLDDSDLTKSDATIGTLGYMAPEQFGAAREVDGRSDLFSLACVACEALTGVIPEREGPERAAHQLHDLRPDLSPPTCKALTTPLATARDERPTTVAQWLDSLDRGRTRTPRVAVGVAAAIGALALAGLLIRSLIGPAAAVPDRLVAVLPFAVDGSVEGIQIDSLLPQAFAWQLEGFPGFRVLEESAVRAAIVRRYGAQLPERDDLLELVAELDATRALIGQATVTGTTTTVRVDLYDAERKAFLGGAQATGPIDSLHNLVSILVLETFGARVAAERLGTQTTSLPVGLPAVTAYFQGDRAFRRGAFRDAIVLFDRVIAMDSTFAPAYLKRTLATVLEQRPTRLGAEVGSALNAADRYRDRLDPISRRLLEGYLALLRRGDIDAAERTFRDIVDENPEVVDGWLLLGLVQLSLRDRSALPSARRSLQEAVLRDPEFAAAMGLLVFASVALNDEATARLYMQRYLRIDSTSVRAELIRLGDTLLFRPTAVTSVLGTFPSRPTEVLEFFGLAAGEMHPPPGVRPIAIAAIDALLPRAATPGERAVTFRMRLAAYLGSGQHTAARDFVRQARVRGVPPSEVDRWVVLGHLTGVASLADTAAVSDAARRLASDSSEPLVSRWLHARWARAHAPGSVREADSLLGRLRSPADVREFTPLENSLFADLAALDRLAASDTAGALAMWASAIERKKVDELFFGTVASLWPLRLDLIRVAAAAGAWEEVRRVARSFNRMSGFVDQVAFEPVLLADAAAAKALGDSTAAALSYRTLADLYFRAGDEREGLRDSLRVWIAELTGR